MPRTTKTLGFSVPSTVAREDHDEYQWILKLIADAQREQKENPRSPEELLAESKRLSRAGQRQAKKLGIETSDAEIVRWIHEQRAKRSA
ncbi:MAG: hypothetical protein ACR2NN_00535 [Bryobacteraceae bacterium]